MKPKRLSKTRRDLILSVEREVARNERLRKELEETERARTLKSV